jgi:hypothetical protein
LKAEGAGSGFLWACIVPGHGLYCSHGSSTENLHVALSCIAKDVHKAVDDLLIDGVKWSDWLRDTAPSLSVHDPAGLHIMIVRWTAGPSRRALPKLYFSLRQGQQGAITKHAVDAQGALVALGLATMKDRAALGAVYHRVIAPQCREVLEMRQDAPVFAAHVSFLDTPLQECRGRTLSVRAALHSGGFLVTVLGQDEQPQDDAVPQPEPAIETSPGRIDGAE